MSAPVRLQSAKERMAISAGDPPAMARTFVRLHCTVDGVRALHFWNGSFWRWTGSYYRGLDDSELRCEITRFLQNDVDLEKEIKDGVGRVPPTSWHISNALDALRGLVHLSVDKVSPPQFLDDTVLEDGAHLTPVHNGTLNLSTAELYDPSPAFFNLYAIAADYDSEVQCENWLRFLAQIWPNDQQAINCLQEIFGYLLESRNDLQKAFMLIGPPRSGKGTIAHVLECLKGGNVAKPSLKDFTTSFGLEPLIGKSLAIISDARLDSRKSDVAMAVEQILSITGGGRPSVNRKYKSAYELGLDTVFLILANELPMLPDTSGALPNRFVPLRIFVSFLGKEDPTLFWQKLEPEMSGILNWAIEGWWRLRERGYFVLPESASDELEGFADLSNPLSQFYVDEGITLMPVDSWPQRFVSALAGFLVDKAVLYDTYVRWCKGHEQRPKHYSHFFRDVAATGANTNYRWDPITYTSYAPDGKKAQRWVRGVILK